MLFGEAWSREETLSLRDRSLVTVTALMAQGLADSSFQRHLMAAKQNGINKPGIAEILAHANTMVFPIGQPNDGFAQYFTGQSYLAPPSTEQVGIFNVTLGPGRRNNWHIHHADRGGGQILVCVAGRGWYQEWGQEARALRREPLVKCVCGALPSTSRRQTAMGCSALGWPNSPPVSCT